LKTLHDALTAAAAVAFAAGCTAAMAQPLSCPPEPPRALLERFVAAPCVLCWKEAPPVPQKASDGAWVLDWVVPARDDAPGSPPGPDGLRSFLAAAALPEAGGRVARSGLLGADEAFSLSHPLAARTALAIQVRHTVSNNAVELRLAARFTSQRPLPDGLEGWVALVERIPAGQEGSTVERQLIRAVAGPLSMAGLPKQIVEQARTVNLAHAVNVDRLDGCPPQAR
jgi:hypothetical protein